MNRQTTWLWCVGACLPLALTGCGGPAKAPEPARKAAPLPPADPWGARPVVPPISGSEFPRPMRVRITSEGQTAQADAGLEVLVVERHDSPAIFLRWVLPGGRALEFSGVSGRDATRWPEGTVEFTARMLTEGTKSHRSSAFAAALEGHGATLEFNALPDAVIIQGRVLSHQLVPYLALMKEALTEPEFSAQATGNLRKRYLAALENMERQPPPIARRVRDRLVFGPLDPYGSPGLTMASVQDITPRHMQEALRSAFRLGGSSLVVVGDVKSAVLVGQLREVFGKHLDGTAAQATLRTNEQLEPTGCHLVDVPEAVQTAISGGNPAPAYAARERAQLVVANQILGGSASSRLFTVLRERKGLTYGIYSDFNQRRRGGAWAVSTSVRTAKTREALEALQTELRLMRSALVKPDELTDAQQFLAGQFVLSQASSPEVAERLAAAPLYGLEDGVWSTWVGALQQVTPEQIRAVAEKWMGQERSTTVLVGKVADMRPAIDHVCTRISLRDPQGRLLKRLLADDNEMRDEDRAALFALWADGQRGLQPMRRFVAEARRSADFRADALMAWLDEKASDQILVAGSQASDWPAVASALTKKLVAALQVGPPTRARQARAVLLDILSPQAGARCVLPEAEESSARAALAAWAFAGITPDSETAATQKTMEERLVAADLARLGTPAAEGLEALISTNVWRVEAGKALIAFGSGAAARALVRAYRRSLVQRQALANAADLEVIGALPSWAMALVLLDNIALHHASDKVAARTAAAQATETLRSIIDTLDRTPSQEPKDRGAARTELARDFHHLEAALERVLKLSNADDRWWAASLIVRHRGGVGLRVVMDELADDDHYGKSRWHTVDPARAIGRLCRDDILPVGADPVRALMLARLQHPHRIGKVVAVTCLKALGDSGSTDALRTNADDTDVGPSLGLAGVVSVGQLARAALDVRAYMAGIDKEVAAGRLSGDLGQLHKDHAYFTLDLTGAKLQAEVARRVRADIERSSGADKAGARP